MKLFKYSIFLVIPVLFSGCLYFNKTGVGQHRYHECKEGYDADGKYFKECDKNLGYYKDIPPLLGMVNVPKVKTSINKTTIKNNQQIKKIPKKVSVSASKVDKYHPSKVECASVDMIAISQKNMPQNEVKMSDIQRDIATLCGESMEK